MERSPTWRPIEPDEPAEDDPSASAAAAGHQQSGDGLRLALAGLAGAAVIAAAALMLWAGTPQAQVVVAPDGSGVEDLAEPFGTGEPQPGQPSADTAELLVDVEGAVVRPGLQRLAPGSRVGDAIAAAGGYGAQVDIRAAAERLNLAEKLADGAKIYVPARGDATPPPDVPAQPEPGAGVGGGAGASGALIDVNTASQAQLETLPGIGPVTAGKIIGAREEAVFATIDDLLARKVVGPATFEKIRTLITVSP